MSKEISATFKYFGKCFLISLRFMVFDGGESIDNVFFCRDDDDDNDVVIGGQ